MSAPSEETTFSTLQSLIGMWAGAGRGDHPPIEAFRYREELTFREHGLEPLVHFEQRTWLIGANPGQEEPSHWESGFLRAVGGNRVEMTNAQNGVRVEVMAGSLDEQPDGSRRLELTSLLHGNDERVRETTRDFRWTEHELHYVVRMATNTTTTLTEHLRAELHRDRGPG